MWVPHKMKECLSCRQTMMAIYSYDIREVCHPCGGKAKSEKDDHNGKQEHSGVR